MPFAPSPSHHQFQKGGVYIYIYIYNIYIYEPFPVRGGYNGIVLPPLLTGAKRREWGNDPIHNYE